ncbi:MAG: helix-turn-helix domain-containing protein [Bacteroidia bacterium]|nr:helix-turn-helix domain-containing protein [Bacteroidia bacterium]
MYKSVEFLVGLSIFLFLFFAFFLFFFQKGNRWSKRFLGLLFLSLGLAVADVFLLINETYLRFPQYAYFLNALPLIYGPLLWFFTQSVIKKDFKMNTKDLLHFIPFALVFISMIFIYHIRHIDFKREFLKRALEDPGSMASASSFIIILSIGSYIYSSHKRVKRYRARIKEEVSNIIRINLGWLDFTLFGFIVIMALTLSVQIVHTFFPANSNFNLLLLILLFVLLVFVMSAIVKGLRSDVSFETVLKENEIGARNKRMLTHEELNELNLLKEFMLSQKPFLDPSLTLKNLAGKMNMSSRELSYLINQGEGHSFFDFVNRYRIQFAQEKIADAEDKKLTILEVMYASGFNSKSSFNTAFKKHSGLTPTQWKKLNS